MKKRTIHSEAAYFIGLILIAVGVGFMEKSDFGVSMVVAPAYVLYRHFSLSWSWFTFGMAEYVTQGVFLLLMIAVLRHVQLSYLLSFATAIIYGLILDAFMLLFALFQADSLIPRLVCFAVGMLFCSAGVSMMFHTYLSPEVYELFVKEISRFFGLNINKVKTGYDIGSTMIAIALSFLFFGFGTFIGVKVGTLYCAVVNGWLIGRMSRFIDRRFEFKDLLPWRDFFLKEPELKRRKRDMQA